MVKTHNGLMIRKDADAKDYQFDLVMRQDMMKFASKYYDVPGRHYHNFEHVEKMLDRHRQYFDCDPTDKLFFAILMHDAIWIAGQSPRSEEMSAALIPYVYYQVTGRQIPMGLNDSVFELIRWTIASVHSRDNRPPSANSTKMNEDAMRILDLDLSSMGLDWMPFVEIQRAIDLEFEHMGSPHQRRLGAATFLRQFVDKGFVYYTPQMQQLNAKALRNLKAYILCAEQHDTLDWHDISVCDPDKLEGLYE
jgi:predicted metal-dependent HD superfamily phosphohydrolase